MAYIVYHNPRRMEWGVGHHLKNIWSTFTFAEEFGLNPVKVNIPGPWAPWTDFLNYNAGLSDYPTEELERAQLIVVGYGGRDIELYRELIEPYKDKNVIFESVDNTRFMLHQMTSDEKRKKVSDYIRKCYWDKRETDPIDHGLDTSKINVAVHIRRGDIQPHHPGVRGRMWIDEQYFLNAMKKVNQLGNVKFRIYSNVGERFESIVGDPELDVELVLGLNRQPEKEFGIFHQMLCSDILIGSPSNFTYLLGEMSDIVVLKLERIIPYVFEGNNFDYSLAPYSSNVRCIETQEDGSFDFEKLKNYIK